MRSDVTADLDLLHPLFAVLVSTLVLLVAQGARSRCVRGRCGRHGAHATIRAVAVQLKQAGLVILRIHVARLTLQAVMGLSREAVEQKRIVRLDWVFHFLARDEPLQGPLRLRSEPQVDGRVIRGPAATRGLARVDDHIEHILD